jgi:hypothetical protein
LKSLVLKVGPNTGLYNFIQAYDATRNGRAAYLALKAQPEGPAAIPLHVQSAYHQTTNARFANLTRKFTFDQYVAIFQTSFNDLEMYGQPVADNKKYTDFLAVIICSELQTLKTIVKSNPDLVGNFEVCQQFIKQQLNNLLVNVPVTQNVSFACATTTTIIIIIITAAITLAVEHPPTSRQKTIVVVKNAKEAVEKHRLHDVPNVWATLATIYPSNGTN